MKHPLLLILLFFAPFTLTVVFTPPFTSRALKAGFSLPDLHKPHRPAIANGGGLIILFTTLPFILLTCPPGVTPYYLAPVLGASLLGLIDDLVNLPHRLKVLLTLTCFLPVFYIASVNGFKFNLPFLQIPKTLSPLVFLVFCCFVTNAFNTLAGFNGLEAGLTVTINFILFLACLTVRGEVPLPLLPFIGSLVGFLIYNSYPAKIFPGNVGTFFMGSLTASLAVFLNLEKYLAVLMLPHLFDLLLKLTVRFKCRGLKGASLSSDGTLNPPAYPSLVWLVLKVKRLREPELVTVICLVELAIGLTAILTMR